MRYIGIGNGLDIDQQRSWGIKYSRSSQWSRVSRHTLYCKVVILTDVSDDDDWRSPMNNICMCPLKCV